VDVPAGNGNASLAAARRGAVVTATDYVGALLEGTAARAAAEGLHITCREGDAEAMPCADGEWDAVLSTFGAVDGAARDSFEHDLLALAEANNTATNGTLRVPSDYLEIVIRKD
jgi:hypothetical protein